MSTWPGHSGASDLVRYLEVFLMAPVFLAFLGDGDFVDGLPENTAWLIH